MQAATDRRCQKSEAAPAFGEKCAAGGAHRLAVLIDLPSAATMPSETPRLTSASEALAATIRIQFHRDPLLRIKQSNEATQIMLLGMPPAPPAGRSSPMEGSKNAWRRTRPTFRRCSGCSDQRFFLGANPLKSLAEGGGFEPPVPYRVHGLAIRCITALPSLQQASSSNTHNAGSASRNDAAKAERCWCEATRSRM